MATICIPQQPEIPKPLKMNVIDACVCPPCPPGTAEAQNNANTNKNATKLDTKPANEASASPIKKIVTRPKKRSRSCELRGGDMHRGCDCEKHNGLQDSCPRTGCQGSADCVNIPAPACQPSEFSNFKHLKTFPRSTKAKFRYDVFSVTNQPATTSYYIIN